MKNGATHDCIASSYIGLLSFGCSGPSKPSDKENGFANTAKSSGLVLSFAIVAPSDAMVPPEN